MVIHHGIEQPQVPTTRDWSHGATELADLTLVGYSLDIAAAGGQIGDQGSQTAFRNLLDQWRRKMADMEGVDPLGPTPTDDISPQELDRVGARADCEQLINSTINEFAGHLADVIDRFGAELSWRRVEFIAIGGGFKETAVGRRAIRATADILEARGHPMELRPIHQSADHGGLTGWLYALPDEVRASGNAILAVDIGGTHVRCGIVTRDGDDGRVVRSERWTHADEKPGQDDLIQGIVAMLRRLIEYAAGHRIALAPFVGVSCPGTIREDGSIQCGTENLPGDWVGSGFHLPCRLQQSLPRIGGSPPQVLMHNDAVIQGLSELPRIPHVDRWAVLTIGTGLGNAVFENHRAGNES